MLGEKGAHRSQKKEVRWVSTQVNLLLWREKLATTINTSAIYSIK